MLNEILKKMVLFTFSLLFATSWCSQPLGQEKSLAAILAPKKQAYDARRDAAKAKKARQAQEQQANLKKRQQRISEHTARIKVLAEKKALKEQQLKQLSQEKAAKDSQQAKLFWISVHSFIEIISFDDWKRMIDKDSQV